MAKKTSVLWSKFAIGLISVIIAAGLIFCIVALIMSCVHGTGFAEEITSWFTKTVEETEEVVETTANFIRAFIC